MIDVTAAIIEKDNKFLIAKRKEGKHLEHKWEFPGGKVEPSETPEACLQRELKEEFGIIAQVDGFIGESLFDYGNRNIRLLGYLATYISGEFQLNDHEEIRWISKEEFGQFDFAPADLPLIEKVVGKSRKERL